MTVTLKPFYRGAVPASKDFTGAAALYTVPTTVPATSAMLKSITLGNVANGIPVGFVQGVGGAFWTTNWNGSTANTGGVGDFPCADQSPDGSIYFTNRYAILKMDAAGTVTIFAGQPGVAAHADGTGTAATFQGITDLAIDSTGTNMYVCDAFYVRKIVLATGQVTTIAGTGTQGQTANATGTSANLEMSSLCIAPDDSALYLVPLTGKDNGNTGGIYKIALTGVFPVTLVVASAVPTTTSGTGYAPNRIAIDAAGTTLWYTDANYGYGSNGNLKKVATTGGTIQTMVTTANLCAVACDWAEQGSAYFNGNGANINKYETVAGSVQGPKIVIGDTGGAVGTADGPPGIGKFCNAIASIKIRGRYALIMTFGQTGAATQTVAMYRVHLTDGYLQCIAGGPNNTLVAGGYGSYSNLKGTLKMPVRVKLYVVPSGQTPGEQYQLGKLLTVDPGETLSMSDLDISMSQGDTLWAESLTPGATINASGLESA